MEELIHDVLYGIENIKLSALFIENKIIHVGVTKGDAFVKIFELKHLTEESFIVKAFDPPKEQYQFASDSFQLYAILKNFIRTEKAKNLIL